MSTNEREPNQVFFVFDLNLGGSAPSTLENLKEIGNFKRRLSALIKREQGLLGGL